MFLVVPDGYQKDDVVYVWTHGNGASIKISQGMRLSQFDLVDFPSGNGTFILAGGIYLIVGLFRVNF